MNSDIIFLNNVKVGDDVLVDMSQYGKISYYSTKIKRITKTMIVVDYYNGTEKRFRKDGFVIGGNIWSTQRLVEPTKERYEQIKYSNSYFELEKNIEKFCKVISKNKLTQADINNLNLVIKIIGEKNIED